MGEGDALVESSMLPNRCISKVGVTPLSTSCIDRNLCCPKKGRSPPPSIVRSMQDVERGVAPTFEMQRFGSMEDSTSASPSTIILDPLAPLVSAPVPEVIVETVPLKSILTKAV